MLTYEIEFHSHGVLRRKFKVQAIERGVIGNYLNGVPYGPDESAVVDGLPFHVRKAASRALFWCTNMSDVQRMDLNRKSDGAALGSIFARLESM